MQTLPLAIDAVTHNTPFSLRSTFKKAFNPYADDVLVALEGLAVPSFERL